MLERPTFLKQMFSHAPKFMFSLPGHRKNRVPLSGVAGAVQNVTLARRGFDSLGLPL